MKYFNMNLSKSNLKNKIKEKYNIQKYNCILYRIDI